MFKHCPCILWLVITRGHLAEKLKTNAGKKHESFILQGTEKRTIPQELREYIRIPVLWTSALHGHLTYRFRVRTPYIFPKINPLDGDSVEPLFVVSGYGS